VYSPEALTWRAASQRANTLAQILSSLAPKWTNSHKNYVNMPILASILTNILSYVLGEKRDRQRMYQCQCTGSLNFVLKGQQSNIPALCVLMLIEQQSTKKSLFDWIAFVTSVMFHLYLTIQRSLFDYFIQFMYLKAVKYLKNL